jgi:hypothetical protein
MELVVRPFEYRLAAEYWRVRDPRLAVQTHAVVGGTPAYLRFVGGDVPQDPEDFDDWVRRTVLDPGTPLFREARYLLEEEADVRDSALYHSVLAAVATGNSTRGGIASYIGRKATDIGHLLNVLEHSARLRRARELLAAKKFDVRDTVLACYSGVGFDGELSSEGDVRAVGLGELYR